MERAKHLDGKSHLLNAECLAFSFGSSVSYATWSLTRMLLLRPADVPRYIIRTQPNCTPIGYFQGSTTKER